MATIGIADVTGPAVARTYSHPSYSDPWECVEDYLRVAEYATTHPEQGSTAVANALDLPRGRIRPWLDGAKPDAVRAIEVADARGWLTPETGSPVFRGLNALVAWIFSGGSISRETYAPYFVADSRRDRELLRWAASIVGVELDITRPGGGRRAQEHRPKEHASVLGRVLVILGAPIGEKNVQSDLTIPPYLMDAPRKSKMEFAAVYLRNRANPIATGPIRFREERSRQFLESLAQFFRDVTGHRVVLSEKNILFSPQAGAAIRSWPEPLLDIE